MQASEAPFDLVYHQATFRRLGIVPVASADQQAFIAERERVCGIRFPASVTEWMGLRGVETLFYEKTNNDFLPFAGNGPEWSRIFPLGDPDQIRQGYLCVASENQGVVIFYVRLDEGDDPPVYHDNGGAEGYDEADEGAQSLAEISWQRVSDTYSGFIYQMVVRETP